MIFILNCISIGLQINYLVQGGKKFRSCQSKKKNDLAGWNFWIWLFQNQVLKLILTPWMLWLFVNCYHGAHINCLNCDSSRRDCSTLFQNFQLLDTKNETARIGLTGFLSSFIFCEQANNCLTVHPHSYHPCSAFLIEILMILNQLPLYHGNSIIFLVLGCPGNCSQNPDWVGAA